MLPGELEVSHRNRFNPGNLALRHGFAEVDVGVEVALQPVDRQPAQAPGEVRLAIIPADVTVGDQIHSGVHLVLDRFECDLVFYLMEFGLGQLALLEFLDCAAPLARRGHVRDFGIITDDSGDQRVNLHTYTIYTTYTTYTITYVTSVNCVDCVACVDCV